MKRLIPSADVVLYATLCVSIVLNYALVYGPRTARRPARPPLWAVGTIAPVVVLDDRNGNRITVDWEQQQKNTVLYVFSPNCGWCQRNLNAVRALVQQQADRYVVVPIALSRKEELEGKPTAELRVSPYLISSPIHRAGYHFGGTPQTIVVDKRGKVLANWIGAYTPGVRPEVEHLLGITIPPIGLSAALNEVPR